MSSAEVSPPAKAIIDGTQQWIKDFQTLSATWAKLQPGNFSVDSFAEWPKNIPVPTLLVTPRAYDLTTFSEWPHPRGYVCREPYARQPFTTENNDAWQREVLLQVDPAASFADYLDMTEWQARGSWEEHVRRFGGADSRRLAVYKALGALPELPSLDDPNLTYDLRIDPMLRNPAGKPVESYRNDNLCNITRSVYASPWDFPSSYLNSWSIPHVPAHQVTPLGFNNFRPEAAPDEYSATIFVAELKTRNPVVIVIHLAGAASVAKAIEQA